jgi:hypothetical protein
MVYTQGRRTLEDADPPRGVARAREQCDADMAAAAGTIQGMDQDRLASPEERATPALPKDESRLEMMAREKRMTLEQRLELFERLSRDAAWARSANRIR